ncbi:MAG TPA: class I SAM-dependent methyltransferase [Gemmatimonadaceae bacterium]|nr:class I SAM-dependent methyltransferase [Gemmatimonadaceae bacterium]
MSQPDRRVPVKDNNEVAPPRAPGLGEAFEQMHAEGGEPWSFSERGVELLRQERVARLVAGLSPRRVLELGCSLGLMTERLSAIPVELWAMDLSPSATRRARQRLRSAGTVTTPRFAVGTATQLPIASDSFDVIVASDGLYSWQLDADGRAAALGEIRRALVLRGHAVLTEHLRPAHFPVFIQEIRASMLHVERVIYFADRPCYQFESWLRAIEHWPVARTARRSVRLARALSALGRPFGPIASRHVCVIARREGQAPGQG